LGGSAGQPGTRSSAYLEQNFSVLPQEFHGRSLAFDLLRTLRLSLRKYAGYGKT
jgi:hypothetical protein